MLQQVKKHDKRPRRPSRKRSASTRGRSQGARADAKRATDGGGGDCGEQDAIRHAEELSARLKMSHDHAQ